MKPLKIIGIIVLIFLLLNLVLFAMGKISDLVFWVVIAAGAVFVYWVLPRLKKKLS